jgi:fermentation-respiration switch protein FrsA (DUF1100 family)
MGWNGIETALDSIGESQERSKNLRRIIAAILVIATLAVVLLSVITMLEGFIERNFIFFPDRALLAEPSDWGMDFEDVYFTTPDGVKLNAWLISAGDEAPMVLWFHGNAGNIGDRVDNAKLLYERGLSLFMIDYRGYGRSGGRASEKGIYADGQAAYEYLLAHGVRAENLVVFGRSLGSTVAIYVASRNKCAGVILESAFTNMSDMAKQHYPVLPGLGVFKVKFPSIDRIGGIKTPILFIHGDEDEIVPYELGRRLFDAASAEKQFYTINGAHHNDTYIVGGKEYFERFERFVRDKTVSKHLPETE